MILNCHRGEFLLCWNSLVRPVFSLTNTYFGLIVFIFAGECRIKFIFADIHGCIRKFPASKRGICFDRSKFVLMKKGIFFCC